GGSELPAPRISPELGQAPVRPLGPSGFGKAAWLVAPAFAAEDDFDRLNQWVPETPELDDYLSEVRKLLTQSSNAALAKSKVDEAFWTKFRAVSAGQELAVKSCYSN